MPMRRPLPSPKLVVSPVSQVEQSAVSPPIDLRQTFVESFLAARELQPNSVRSYGQDLQQFMDWCDRPWNSISQRQVIGFKTYLLDERKLSKNTVRRVLQTLKSFYRWMSMSGHVANDPTKGVQLPEAEEAESQELSDNEVEQIYQAVQESKFPERDRAIITALLHGLRGEEVSKLNVGDYQTQIVEGYASKQLHIREAKAGSTGWVVLFEEGIAEFEAYLAWYGTQVGGTRSREPKAALEADDPMFLSYSNRTKKQRQRLTYWGIREIMRSIKEQTGIDLHSHRGRHTYATNLLIKYGLGEAEAMKLTRHRDRRSFKRYTNKKEIYAAQVALLRASGQL
ncbi:phage integrase N-terminal SAM-like domain-containing protein [Cyanobacteria bacterium FACHB-63]|nr:phage integrase N-terminal SAM-like domain-containing protein [Cyanobacteria bacterium FACHB-63]